MHNALPTSIRRLVADEDVTELRLWFTDVLGELEMVKIAGRRLDELMARGVLPNDSSTSGFGSSAGADIVAVPDWTTFTRLAATGHDDRPAAVFCSLNSMGFVAPDQYQLD